MQFNAHVISIQGHFMRSIILIILTGIYSSLFLGLNPVHAQESELHLELTPFAAYRMGGDFESRDAQAEVSLEDENSYGLLTAWRYDNYRQGELLISHYDTQFNVGELSSSFYRSDIAVTYVHLGGNVQLSEGLVPVFISGGAGITHLSPNNNNLADETQFSANLGLNTRFDVSEQLRLYIGSRVYATLFDTDSEIFCDQTQCAIYVESDVWLQTELSAGITFIF